ncbi:MAG: hypothetical protein J7M08_10615 [Planctomycetes bacterium]|nr:hypothetical protein [Planctomycetota bacterium]
MQFDEREASAQQPGAERSPAGRPDDRDPFPGKKRPATDETIESPLARLAPPPSGSPLSRWLARWLLFAGVGPLALAAVAIVISLWHGTHPIEWRGGLVAFDFAIIVLIVRGFAIGGAHVRKICRRVFSLLGLTAGIIVLQVILLRSATRFVYGAPPLEVLSRFFTFGLLGLAGCIIFIQSLRGLGWACRTASISSLVFAILLLVQFLKGSALFGHHISLPQLVPSHSWGGVASAVGCAAALAIFWDWPRHGSLKPLWRWAIRGLWLLLLLAASTLVSLRLLRLYDYTTVFQWLWVLSLLWAALALLPVAGLGMALVWRRRRDLETDLLEATNFIWILVVVGALAALAVWAPLRWKEGGIELLLVMIGILSSLVVAWLGTRRRQWFSSWAILPAVGLVVAVMCALSALLDMAAPEGTVWMASTAFLWSVLVVGLALASGGLIARRRLSRLRQGREALRNDVDALGAVGAVVALTVLWLVFAIHAASSEAAGSIYAITSNAARYGKDILALCLGSPVANGAQNAIEALAAAWRPFWWAAIAGAALIALALNATSARRARWNLTALALLWAPPVIFVSLLALGFSSRLFFPWATVGLRTALGRSVESGFSTRLLTMVALVALAARLWEAFLSIIRLRRQGARLRTDRGHSPETAAPSEHLIFLVRAAVLLSAVGLVAAFVMFPSARMESLLTQISAEAARWCSAAFAVAANVGVLSAQWSAYAICAGIALYLLLSVSEEARHGRVAAYPLLAGFWTLLLAYLTVEWMRMFRQGLSPAMLAALLPGAAFLLATIFLWARWLRLRRDYPGESASMRDPRPQKSAAYGLGSLTLGLCALAGALVLHAALRPNPWYASRLTALTQRLHEQGGSLLNEAARRTANWDAVTLRTTALIVAVFSAGSIALHMLARRGLRAIRAMVAAVWAGLALAGAAAATYLVSRPRSWSAAQLAAAFLISLLLLRVIIALLNARRWSSPGRDAGDWRMSVN